MGSMSKALGSIHHIKKNNNNSSYIRKIFLLCFCNCSLYLVSSLLQCLLRHKLGGKSINVLEHLSFRNSTSD
jgi:hypothetical protein